MEDAGIHWFKLIMGLFGGLALFLYGMDLMSSGMKKFAGNKMRSFLATVTNNRLMGLLSGTFVTMIIQSSSATTVMLVSFVQAGLMSVPQTMGVILGADIGTTITAQLVAFKLTDYALLAIASGFAISFFSKQEKYKHLSQAILGFGVLFFGMKIMGDSMIPIRTYEPFINSIAHLQTPILGILAGALFTAVIQSSSAFTGIIIVLAQQNIINLEAGIPLVMGANIGTCITAGIACVGTTREAKRVALSHTLFKIFGVLLIFPFIAQFTELIRYFSHSLDASVARQIAHAHTIFNVSMAFVALPFVNLFAKLVLKILPESTKKIREEEEDRELLPSIRNLDKSLISVPSLAIQLARAEIFQMVKLMEKMVNYVIIPFMKEKIPKDEKYPQISLIQGLKIREEKIDFLEEKIGNYLLKISQQNVTDEESNEVIGLISIMNDIESIADIIDKNIIPLIPKKRSLENDFSFEGREEISMFHIKICKQISRIKFAFQDQDPKKGLKAMNKMEEYLDLESQYRMKHLQRLGQLKKETVKTHEIHMELMDMMKQINVYSGNIGKMINQIAVKTTLDK